MNQARTNIAVGSTAASAAMRVTSRSDLPSYLRVKTSDATPKPPPRNDIFTQNRKESSVVLLRRNSETRMFRTTRHMAAEKARAPGEGLRCHARTATMAEMRAAASNGSVYSVICMFNPFPFVSYVRSLH